MSKASPETVKLRQKIREYLAVISPREATTAQIVDRMFNTRGADSNHPKYKLTLRALLYEEQMQTVARTKANGYSPSRWFFIGDIPF